MNKLPYKLIDTNQWVRREIYEFFLEFEEPFHGVTVPLDMTLAKSRSSVLNVPIFHYYMYHFIHAINESVAMKLRIYEGKVVEFHEIHSGITIMKEDNTFAYGHIFKRETLQEFSLHMEEEKERVKSRGTLRDKEFRYDMVHFSVLPWTNFSSLSHARRFGSGDSIPKITFGKITGNDEKWEMPLSIHVHHALADGKDVADFITIFQDKLNNG